MPALFHAASRRPCSRDDAGDGVRDRPVVRHVEVQRRAGPAGLLHELDGLGRSIVEEVGDVDVGGALPGEDLGSGPAHAPAGPRDQHDLACCQLCHPVSPRPCVRPGG